MAKDKRSVIIYTDWISTFEELEDDEAGRLIKHFFRYVNDMNPDPPDRITRLLFEPIKQTLKRDLKKYEGKRLKNKENAKMRWDKKNATACDRIKSDANHADSDSVIVSDSVIDNDIINIWDRWKKYKREEFNFKYKSKVSEDAAKKELMKLSGGDLDLALKIIEQSISKGWKGFFKLDNNGSNKKDNGATSEQILGAVNKYFPIKGFPEQR